jgi:hypothetical protein
VPETVHRQVIERHPARRSARQRHGRHLEPARRRPASEGTLLILTSASSSSRTSPTPGAYHFSPPPFSRGLVSRTWRQPWKLPAGTVTSVDGDDPPLVHRDDVGDDSSWNPVPDPGGTGHHETELRARDSRRATIPRGS